MSDKEQNIIKAAQMSGFNLEFKAKEILDANNYSTEIGKCYTFNDDYIEPDIVSTQFKGRYLIGECKGSSADSILILIKEANKNNNDFNSRGFKISDAPNSKLVQFEPDGWDAFKTITGDFYSSNLKKISKNDSKNNFYKAQNQITSGIKALADSLKNDKSEMSYITPFILTNSEIWIIDFNKDTTQAKPYKWALHETLAGSSLPLELACGEQRNKYCLPIINIQYFDEFVQLHSKFFAERWQIPLSNGLLTSG